MGYQRSVLRRRTLLLAATVVVCLVIFQFGPSPIVVFVTYDASQSKASPQFAPTKMAAALSLQDVPSQTSYVDAVAERASADRWIVVAVIDEAFLDMALNFYETSLKRLDIDNFLFVGFGDRVCKQMHVLSLPCYYYPDSVNSKSASSFFSAEFTRKSHRRNNVIIDAIEANYTVLYTDVDIVFLQNPLPELKVVVTRHIDVATQWESGVHNSGFVVARPTKGAIYLYKEMNRLASASPQRFKNQVLMNTVIKKTKSLRMLKLYPPRYAGGKTYFETPGRPPANLSSVECQGQSCTVIAHNTWIVSKAAKVYRFREHLLWMYDENGEYYGSKTNKYITYNNSMADCKFHSSHTNGPERVAQDELAALQTVLAIGFMLQRIVILPMFHCGPKCNPCRLNSLLQISNFDDFFTELYRESSFLLHPKVPHSTKNSLSEPLAINAASKNISTLELTTVHDNTIIDLFGNRNEIVLSFSSFQGLHVKFSNQTLSASFSNRLRKGFRRGRYRQY